MRQDMKRIAGVITRRDVVAAERIVELDGLTAYLRPDIPDVWDANWLEVDRPGLPVERIVAAGDETIGAAGMRHRTLLTLDQADGERLVAELEPRGWKAERNVYMAHRRPPDRPGSADVEEVGQDEIESSRREFLRDELEEFFGAGKVTPAIIDQFLGFDRIYGEIAGDRWFVAREDRRVVSFCRLFSGEGTGQVEDVATLPAARNRGLARSVVLAAVEASRAAGHDLTFLGALTDDWPRKLYKRLGFDEVGPEIVLYRKPDSAR